MNHQHFFHEFQSLMNPFKMNLSNSFFQFKQSQQRQLQQKLSIFHTLSPGSPGVFLQVGGAQLPSGSAGGPCLLPGDAHGRQGGNDGTKNDGRRNR
jgi:hypothetical protein